MKLTTEQKTALEYAIMAVRAKRIKFANGEQGTTDGEMLMDYIKADKEIRKMLGIE